jgi:hypothetical protein
MQGIVAAGLPANISEAACVRVQNRMRSII